MTTRIRFQVLAACLAVWLGCGDSASRDASADRVRLGDTIVVRSGTPAWGDSTLLVEETTIGALEGTPEYQFGDFMLDGRARAGCSIRFETTEALLGDRALPDLRAAPGSALAALGWSVDPSIGADGPGSSVHALSREDVQCVASWAQPSYLDDDGEFVASETITVVIQCEDAAGLNTSGLAL